LPSDRNSGSHKLPFSDIEDHFVIFPPKNLLPPPGSQNVKLKLLMKKPWLQKNLRTTFVSVSEILPILKNVSADPTELLVGIKQSNPNKEK